MKSRILVTAAAMLVLMSTGLSANAVRRHSPPKQQPLLFNTWIGQGGGGEPGVAVSPNGRNIMVDGLGSSSAPANFLRSTDGGKTFKFITPTFPKVGGGDWDMHWLDNQSLIAADLSLGPDGIIVDRSTDAGMTWTSTSVASDVYDRPWIDHFGENDVYLVTKGFDNIPYLYTSTDGGRSFGTPPIPILIYGTDTANGQDPVNDYVVNQNAYVDHLVVDGHSGDVYVLYGIDGADSVEHAPLGMSNRLYVAHLEDGKMVSHPVHIGDATEGFIAGFNWMCVDAKGTLYVMANGVMNGRYSTYLSYSKDKGVTWSPLKDIGLAGPGSNVYGAIAAGTPGTLSLFYLHGTDSNPSTNPQDWYPKLAMVRNANTSHPSLTLAPHLTTKPVHQADICFQGLNCSAPSQAGGGNRNLLDYISNAIGPDGRTFAVTASDGPASGYNPGQPSLTSNPPPVDFMLFVQAYGPRFGRGSQS
ncbi:MAG: hypothetical protein ACYDCC_06025 [Actinomycetota bacterium]